MSKIVAAPTVLRQLDALIAEHFFGWYKFNAGAESLWVGAPPLTGVNPATQNRNTAFGHYSTDGNDMLLLIGKLNEAGWWVALLSRAAQDKPPAWRAVCGNRSGLQLTREGLAGPEAVARVALATRGVPD